MFQLAKDVLNFGKKLPAVQSLFSVLLESSMDSKSVHTLFSLENTVDALYS